MVEGNVPFHSVIIQELRGHVVPCVYTAHCGVAEGLDDLLSLLMRVNPRYSLRVTEVRYIFVSRNTTRETKIPVRKWSYSGHTLQLCSQCNTVCLEPKISYIDYINESIKRPQHPIAYCKSTVSKAMAAQPRLTRCVSCYDPLADTDAYPLGPKRNESKPTLGT